MLRRSLLIGLLVLAGALFPSAAAHGQHAPSKPGSELSVYLVTMGQGDLVWEKFGHNAIWVHDPMRGTDWVYNYGVFDFNSPGYWSRFLQGNWIYQLAVADIDQTLAQYRYLNRSVWVQELNLTPAQKRELQDFLQWNARPENREYGYDYYRDNCSTRVRDALDRVLGGQIRAATAGVPTGTTYRWHSERLIAEDKVSYSGLAAGLGPAADQPISAWEEMFLPFKLQEYLRGIEVVNEAGRTVPLVRAEWVAIEAVGRDPVREEPPKWILAYLAAGVGLGTLLLALGRWARRSRLARFGFAALGAVWALLIGTGGLVLLGLWTMTNHTIAYRNENLLQFDPLALPLVLLFPALAYGARWAARPALGLSGAVAAISLLGFALQVLPGFDQVNGEIIALALPVHLALAWAVYGLSRRALTPRPPCLLRRG
jgi:hypothetical protein